MRHGSCQVESRRSSTFPSIGSRGRGIPFLTMFPLAPQAARDSWLARRRVRLGSGRPPPAPEVPGRASAGPVAVGAFGKGNAPASDFQVEADARRGRLTGGRNPRPLLKGSARTAIFCADATGRMLIGTRLSQLLDRFRQIETASRPTSRTPRFADAMRAGAASRLERSSGEPLRISTGSTVSAGPWLRRDS